MNPYTHVYKPVDLPLRSRFPFVTPVLGAPVRRALVTSDRYITGRAMSAQIHGGAPIKRRIFTASVTVQLVLGAMVMTAALTDSISPQMSVPLLIVLYGSALATLLWQSAHSHDEIEGIRCASEEELKQAHGRRLKDLTNTNQRMTELAQELELTRRQKQDIEKFKADFLGHISHEIRTPLNAVVGMAELLSRTEMSSEQQELVGLINSSGETLLSVINDILNYSKIEAGEFSLELAEFDVNELVEGTAQLLAEPARLKEISLSTFIAPTLSHSYFGDAGRLKQVLVNLLGNALRFAQRGEILISAVEDSQDPESVRFTVKDSSSSISTSVVATLFTPMTEVDMITARKYGGTGLGLSVSKKLVELMNGKMGVDSSDEHGTTFWFSAKLQAAPSSEESGNFGVGSLRKKLMIVGRASLSVAVMLAYAKSWGIDCDYQPSYQHALEVMYAKADDYQAVLVETGPGDEQGATEFLKHFFAAGDLCEIHAMVLCEDESTEQGIKNLKHTVQLLRKPFKKAHLREALRQCHLSLRRTGEIVRPEAQLKSFVASVDFATRIWGQTDPGEISRANKVLQPGDLLKGKRLLVVEDNPVNRRLVNLQLKALGMTCDNVENGQEAVEALQSGHYDLVFMDCWMPVLDGFGATAKIRQNEGLNTHTPIVAMTANAMESDRHDCIAAGMDDYISKPVTAAALKGVIEKWLEVPLTS